MSNNSNNCSSGFFYNYGYLGLPRFVRYDKEHNSKFYDYSSNKFNDYKNNSHFYLEDRLADESANARTFTNPDNVILSTSIFKSGQKSFDFVSGKRVTINQTFNFGSGEFTIELFCRPTTVGSYNTLYEIGYYYSGILLRMNSGYIELYINSSQYTANISWILDSWYHIVLQRKAGVLQLIINGVLYINVSRGDALNGLIFGLGYSRHSDGQRFYGYLDKILVNETKALYSSLPFNSEGFVVNGSAVSSNASAASIRYGLQNQKIAEFTDNYGFDINTAPTQINNLALWLDASDPNAVELESGRLKRWLDKSGRNFHATQSILSSMPTFDVYRLNNLKLVTINGSSIGLLTALNLVVPYTIMLVSRNFVGGRVVQSGTINALMCPSGRGNSFYVNGDIRSSSLTAAGTWSIITMQITGSSASQLWYKGVNYGSSTHSNWGTFTIGCFSLYNENPNAEIAEIVVFERSINTAERQILEGEIAWKWDLVNELEANHPYKNNRPSLSQRRFAFESEELEAGENFITSGSDDFLIDEDSNPLILFG